MNARVRTYLSESFGRLRKHAQSCATVCMYAFLITKGDIKYCYATQSSLANNSNRSSHFVTQSELTVSLRLSFVIFKIILQDFNHFPSKFAIIAKFTRFARMRFMDSSMCEEGLRLTLNGQKLKSLKIVCLYNGYLIRS